MQLTKAYAANMSGNQLFITSYVIAHNQFAYSLIKHKREVSVILAPRPSMIDGELGAGGMVRPSGQNI